MTSMQVQVPVIHTAGVASSKLALPTKNSQYNQVRILKPTHHEVGFFIAGRIAISFTDPPACVRCTVNSGHSCFKPPVAVC